jgi:hypothetical protein
VTLLFTSKCGFGGLAANIDKHEKTLVFDPYGVLILVLRSIFEARPLYTPDISQSTKYANFPKREP